MAVRPIDANALVVYLYKETEECIAMEDYVPEQFKEYYHGKMEAFIEVAAHVKRHTPTLNYVPKQQWISVKDRLPPYIGKKILVVNGHGNIKMMAFWNKVGNNWTWLDCDGHFNHTNDITHWMPLPEPPKGE